MTDENSPTCPSCKGSFSRRVERQRLERLWSIFYIFPFRCQLCAERFNALRWGVRYAKQSVDRRQYQRIPTNFPATCRTETNQDQGTVTNISVGGCRLTTEAPLQVEDLIQLDLALPEQSRPVQVETAVIRNLQAEGIGIQFLRFAAGNKERLGEFVLAQADKKKDQTDRLQSALTDERI